MLRMRFRSFQSPYTPQLTGCVGRLERAHKCDLKLHLILGRRLHSGLKLPGRKRYCGSE